MEVKDIIGWIVTLVAAVIGASSIAVIYNKKNNNKNMKNTVNQTITNGDGNVQAGGDVRQNMQGDEE